MNIGVPVPGPIIDTTGGSGGSLTHRYDEIAVTGSSGDTAEIDNRFIDTIVSAFLVDTTTSKLYGLTKNDVVTVTFSDGTSYTVKIGDTTQALEWTCSNVGTSTNVTLVSGSAGKLPNCVTTTGSKTVASVTTSTGKSGSMLVVRTND